jgi:hypothetical protein
MSCSKNSSDLIPEANASQRNLKSASAVFGQYTVFPGPTTTSGSYVTFTESLFQVNRDPSSQSSFNGGSGQKVFAVSGGTRYRATLVQTYNLRAGVQIAAPNCKYTYPATGITVMEWVSGDCTLSGNGVWFGTPGYCNYSLTFERQIN